MPDIANILVIKWKSMGDLLFTIPAVHVLRENFPRARITYMTSAENAGIAMGFIEVDGRLVVDRKVFKSGNPLAMAGSTLDLLGRLRRARFDLVLDLQCYAETAAMAWLSGAPEIWGFQIGNRMRSAAYTRSLPRNDDLHPADANLELLAHCGVKGSPGMLPSGFRLPQTGRDEAREFLARNGVEESARVLFIQPFTSSPDKNWPLDRQMAVAEHWRGQGLRVIFGGGPQERDALKCAMVAGFPVCAGLTLPTVTWVVERAAAVVGGDTGLLHVATAMGRRVVMLMGPRRPGGCIPYGHPDWVVAANPGQRVAEVPVERVNEAIADALREQAAPAIPAVSEGSK
jgi:heptosyltransferase-1